MLIYTTKTAAFTQSLFYVFCLNFSAYTPQSWKLLCSVCVTDDSSTDSAPERLRRHAEWAELNQHTRNVQNKINGTVKLPIYHTTEIKTGGGDPAYILVFCYPHWLSKVCVHVCVCMCVYAFALERETEEEVEDYVWITCSALVWEGAVWRICGYVLVVAKAQDRCVRARLQVSDQGSRMCVCVCVCVGVCVCVCVRVSEWVSECGPLAAVCPAQSGLGSVSLL